MLTKIGSASAEDFIVQRKNLSQCKFVSARIEADLKSGQVLLKVDKFALTANNISYALVGEILGYWDFFPTEEEDWGRIPAWGFAEVVRSTNDGVAEGDRVFGLVPMSTNFVLQPDVITQGGFVDASPHRSKFPLLYKQYELIKHNPLYIPEYEDCWTLFWPLFLTAFLVEEFLVENNFFGAQAVVLSSASSKTALGLAFLLSRSRNSQCKVIGLTSARNLPFVESLGYYSQVVTYEQIQLLPSDLPIVYVDIAGDGKVLNTLHYYFQNMKYNCLLGATHWECWSGLETNSMLPGPRPMIFFAPDEIQRRVQQWGVDSFHVRFGELWAQFLMSTSEWILPIHSQGKAAVERIYLNTLAGWSKPNEGHVLSVWESENVAVRY
jgi:Protein of unknown function (DUF2855)